MSERLKLKFLGALVEQLGAQMYPSVTASIAELVSNAWDADAGNVWITMPLGVTIVPGDGTVISVVDDGLGMTRQDAATKYLIVGRKRRVEEATTRTPSGRTLHGRKGLGKLAAFGTAGELEVVTRRKGELTGFVLDYDAIRDCEAGADYVVPEIQTPAPPSNPETNTPLASGTAIRLKQLRAKRIPVESRFRRSLARRFGVLAPTMSVHLNDSILTRFEMPNLEIRLPRDRQPTVGIVERGRAGADDLLISQWVGTEGDWGVEDIGGCGRVQWWIGFTERPVEHEEQRGISVIAGQKLVQRPFMFQTSQGTSGQLGQQYLVGEVRADWIDAGRDIEDDLIQANRDELQLEDHRLEPFLRWGRSRLRWALRVRNELRTKIIEDDLSDDPELQLRLTRFTARERSNILSIRRSLAALPEAESKGVRQTLFDVLDSLEDKTVREMLERITGEEEDVQRRIWDLVSEFGLIDARRTLSLIDARLAVIYRLEELVERGAREVPDIHNHIKENPWLLDPRWHLYDDKADLTQYLRDQAETQPDAPGAETDYLFTLGADTDRLAEVIIVEIKRGTNPDGSEHHADVHEVQRFQRYHLLARTF